MAVRGSLVSMLPDVAADPSALEKSCTEQWGLVVLGWQSPGQSLCAVLCQLTQASPLCLVQQHSSEHSPPTLIILNVVIILMTVFHFFSLFDGKQSRCAWEVPYT